MITNYLGPYVQANLLTFLPGSQVTTLSTPSDSLIDQVPSVIVDDASSSVGTAIIQPEQGVDHEVTIDKQVVDTNNLVEHAIIQHNKDLAINCQTLLVMNNSLTTNQDKHVKREAIFNLLTTWLRQILHGQITFGVTCSLGSMPILISLIQIDLALLGINSSNITVNFNGQSTATTVVLSVPNSSMLMIQIPKLNKPFPSLPAQPADPLIKRLQSLESTTGKESRAK